MSIQRNTLTSRLWLALIPAAIFVPACTCERPLPHHHDHPRQLLETKPDNLDHTGQATELQFGKPYRYDPKGQFSKEGYEVEKTIVYLADGTGNFTDGRAGKFRWHFTPDTNGGEMVVTEWFDVRDGKGAPVTEEELNTGKVVMHIMRGGNRIHENGSDLIYEIVP